MNHSDNVLTMMSQQFRLGELGQKTPVLVEDVGGVALNWVFKQNFDTTAKHERKVAIEFVLADENLFRFQAVRIA